jgi:GH18 family chitinase
VTTYDYHTNGEGQTGHNSPLFGSGKDINSTWSYLLEKGAIPEKTILGIPFYGHTFNLVTLSKIKKRQNLKKVWGWWVIQY